MEHHVPWWGMYYDWQMDSRRGRGGRNRNVFKGCVLVSILIETHPRRFKSRAVAVKFAKRLLREGYIKSIFGSRSFEDSAQLYMWQDDDAIRRHRATMTSSGVEATPSQQERIYESHQRAGYESLRREEVTEPRYERLDAQLIEDVKNKVLNRSEGYNIVTSYNTFFQELQRDFRSEGDKESEHNYYNEAPPRQQQPPLRQQQHQPQQSGDHQYQKSQPPQQQPYQPHRHHQQTPPEHSQQKHRVKPQQQQQQQHKPASAPREATQYLSQQTPRSRHPHSHQSRKYPQGQPSNTPHRSQAFPSSASSGTYHDPYTSDVKRESTCSTDSSVDTQTYFRTRDRNSGKNQQHGVPPPSQPPPLSSRHPQKSVPGAKMASPATNSHTPPQIRDHSSIPEERTSSDPALNAVVDKDKERPEMTSSDYEMTSVGTLSSLHPQAMMLTSNNTSSSPENMAVGSGVGATLAMVGESAASRPARWQHEPAAYSYSDNEKQLIEEMKRMKKEHQNILRTYEGRINKLMAKMHELRNIAEMLENSSTKSSPYGLLPAKATLLNIIASGTKLEEGDKKGSVTGEGDVPPPLPPRPGRGGRIYPNKPIIHTRTRMKALPWNRIILGETGTDGGQTTVWHGMPEAKFDTEEVERLYSCPPEPSTDDVTLLDDIYAVRGKPKHQPLAMFDAERSQRILTEMRNLRCSLSDVINAISSLDCHHLHQDSFAELLELLNSPRDVDKILHHVRRKGPGQLDTPEFLIFEMSKLDHFRERLEFLRFKNKLQINLFEIDQQLRELNTACDELVNNLPLKNVLETVLALGNYLNGGTERGQADGFGLDILNKLKDFVDRSRRGNLLELIMRTYCLQYEADLDLGCPTRFRLPEPSNMRHAAQVSFEEIQKALRDLREELSQVRDRLEVLSKRESSNLTIALRVTSENFLTSAVEVLAEEKRFLEDTKGHFWKTTAYFLYNRQCTPQEFFQTWATFLHDCKYYWKLAHRNLARDKFERDFSTKCQLSCSSLPGFTNLKNKMIRTVASLQNDQEMRASKAQQLLHINNWIESLGRYDQELGPELPHVPRDATYGNGPLDPGAHATATTPGQHDRKHQHQQHHRGREQGGGSHAHHHHQQQQQQHGPARSSSPKPITSTPPNVHKPQPISHVSPTTVSSTYSSTSFPNNVPNGTGSGSSGPNNAPCNGGGSGGGGGYHHQHFQSDANALEEPYESLSRATMAMSQEAEPPRGDLADSGSKRHSQDGGQKKNPNFSLKSWLKREQRQRSSNDELPSPTGPSPQYPSPQQQQQQPSAKSPTTPFNKLRNSVVQKFSGSGSSKKSNETPKSGGGSSISNHHNAPVVPPKPPRALVDNDPPPSHQILFTPQQQQQQQLQQQQQAEETEPKRSSQDMPDYEARDYQNFYYQSRGGSKERGFPTGHESAPSTLSSVTSRDFSPNKFEAFTRVDGSRQRDSSRDRARYGSQERNLNPPNEALQQLAPPTNADTQQKDGRGRNRAPIALNLGSNMSISDVYGRQEEDARQAQQQQQQPQQQQAEVAPQPQYPANHLAVEGSRDAGPHLPPQPSNVDSKRVKANPVPVYKAKLIPNYENQTKLDPRMEHGIRGQAEPVHQPPLGHFAQSSNSSEVYRQELQRKSEMYVGSYPQQSPLSPTPPGQGSHHNTPNNQALSQTPPNQGSSSYTPHGPALSQTPPGSASYPLNQALSQAQPNPTPSYNPHPSQVPPSQTPMSQGSYPHPGQAPFSQTTPKGSATSVTARDGGVGPVNPNSPDYDDFQTPARRSASAQNILDRGYGTDGYRQSHNSDPSGPSHSYLASIGNFSASLGSPTSKRGEEARGKAPSEREPRDRSSDTAAAPPAKVSTLINRWEKKHGPEEGMGGPLVDGQDRPPSMTSTPVTRRKHPAASGGDGEGGVRSATVHPQTQRHHQPVTSSYDAQGLGGVSNGPGQFVSGGGSQRSHGHGHHREREAYRQGHSPHHSHSPQRQQPQPQSQTPRSHAFPSPHQHPHHHPQQQQQQLPPQQPTSYHHPQQHPHPQHNHPATNTYPPRSSHPPPRLPNDVSSNLDIPDSYSDQLRKVAHMNGGEGGKPSKPVPLPRHNIPGAMAVVKPTVMHQGQLTFMEI